MGEKREMLLGYKSGENISSAAVAYKDNSEDMEVWRPGKARYGVLIRLYSFFYLILNGKSKLMQHVHAISYPVSSLIQHDLMLYRTRHRLSCSTINWPSPYSFGIALR